MKYLKRFESKDEIDIYQFHNLLLDNSQEWDNRISYRSMTNNIEDLSDRFIGPGIYDKVADLVDRIFISLSLFDIEDIKYRITDIFDEYLHKDKMIFKCVLYGDIERYGNKNQNKFNGVLGIGETEIYKRRILYKILLDMLRPTVWIGHPSVRLRMEHDEIYVTDPIYQCCNFDINNFSISKIEKTHQSKLSQYDINKKENYDINHFFEMYRPGIYISIGERNISPVKNQQINLRSIESEYDKILPSVLHDIDYEDILWGYSRGERMFDDNMLICDYCIKILLKC